MSEPLEAPGMQKEVSARLKAAIKEGTRLRALSNQDLVREHRRLLDHDNDEDELHVLEMYSRLWPEWHEEEI